MPNPSTEHKEPDAFEKWPGLAEFHLREVIRELVEEYGPVKARFLLSLVLEEQEKMRAGQ